MENAAIIIPASTEREKVLAKGDKSPSTAVTKEGCQVPRRLLELLHRIVRAVLRMSREV